MGRKIPLCKFCGDPIAPEGLDRVLLLHILALWGEHTGHSLLQNDLLIYSSTGTEDAQHLPG